MSDQRTLEELTFFPASVKLIDGSFVHCLYAEDDEYAYFDRPLVPIKVRDENTNSYRIVYDMYDPFTDDVIIVIHHQDIMTVTTLSKSFEKLYYGALQSFSAHIDTKKEQSDIDQDDSDQSTDKSQPTLH